MKRIKILIADDHQLVIDGIKSLVKNIPEIEVVAEANNGKEIFDLASLSHIDVALMDINMPVLNGIDSTKQLKRLHPQIKVLALSMHDDKTMIESMLNAGALGYIMKNANKDELILAIKKTAAGQKYFSSEVALTLMGKQSTEIISEKNKKEVDTLTKREIEIMKLVALGFSSIEIGKKLFISPRTVETHRTNLFEKLQVKNVAMLIRYAMKNGYMD